MRSFPAWTAAMLVLLALVLSFTSCLGRRSQSTTLFPAAATAWPGVRADFDAGVADALSDQEIEQRTADMLDGEADAFGAALVEKDQAALRALSWPTIDRYARRGIDWRFMSGHIGSGVALSLTERLDQFAVTITRLQEYR